MVKKVAEVKPNKNTFLAKKNLAKRFNKLKVKANDQKKIVYVGHLPKGFNEEELKKFFVQFGKITKTRVSRSPKVRVLLIRIDCPLKRICLFGIQRTRRRCHCC